MQTIIIPSPLQSWPHKTNYEYRALLEDRRGEKIITIQVRDTTDSDDKWEYTPGRWYLDSLRKSIKDIVFIDYGSEWAVCGMQEVMRIAENIDI